MYTLVKALNHVYTLKWSKNLPDKSCDKQHEFSASVTGNIILAALNKMRLDCTALIRLQDNKNLPNVTLSIYRLKTYTKC